MTSWAEDVVAHMKDRALQAQVERVQMSAKIVGVATRGDRQAPRPAYVDRRTQEAPAGPPCPACGRTTTRREVRQGASVEALRERVFYECQGPMYGPGRCLFGWYEDEADVAARLDAYRQRRTGKVEHLRHQVQGGTYQVPSDEEIAEAMLRRAAEGRTNRPRERREEGEDMPRGSKVNEVKRAQIEEMLRAGKSNREIGKALKCSTSTIYVVRNATGLIGRRAAPSEPEPSPAPTPPQAVAQDLGAGARARMRASHSIVECPWLRKAGGELRQMPLGDYLRQTPEVRAAIDVLAEMEV